MKSLFLIAGMLFFNACASKDSVKTKQADLYFGAGTQSLMFKDYTQALTSLLKANELDPNNSEILNNLAMAYYFKGQYDMAIKYLNESLEINPKNTDAKVNLASIYYHDSKIDEAEAIYKKVLEDLTYDKQARTFYNLGLIEYTNRKNTQVAVEYFNKSIKEDPNYCPSYFQLGLIYFSNRQFKNALKNFKEAGMGTCHESPAPQYYQALSLIELNRISEARSKLEGIESRFKKTKFAAQAQGKLLELREKELSANESHASSKTIESSDF